MHTESRSTESKKTATRRAAPAHRGIRRILVCLDGSPSSAICIPYALSLAQIFDSEVTLLHVMPHHDARFRPHAPDTLDWELSRQEAEARMEQLKRSAARTSGRAIGVRLEQGKPAGRIVALSRELGADLVVLGSHDESCLASWELGSTAQQVLAAASSSVLIARGGTAPATFSPPKRILVPLDGSVRTESVLPTAQRIATALGAELVLTHVVSEPLPTGVLLRK